MARESICFYNHLLAFCHLIQLRFLEIGHHPHGVGYEEQQLRARRHIGTLSDADFRHLSVGRCTDDGVVEIDLREAQLRLGGIDRRLTYWRIDKLAA